MKEKLAITVISFGMGVMAAKYLAVRRVQVFVANNSSTGKPTLSVGTKPFRACSDVMFTNDNLPVCMCSVGWGPK